MTEEETKVVEVCENDLTALRDLTEYYVDGAKKIIHCMKECSPGVRKHLWKMLCKLCGMLDDIKEAALQCCDLPSSDDIRPTKPETRGR